MCSTQIFHVGKHHFVLQHASPACAKTKRDRIAARTHGGATHHLQQQKKQQSLIERAQNSHHGSQPLVNERVGDHTGPTRAPRGGSSKNKRKKFKTNNQNKDTHLSRIEEIWLILPVVICLFQGLSHARLRITAFAGICAWLITSDVICRKDIAVQAVLLDTLAKRQANT
jgi:hypothetical protein